MQQGNTSGNCSIKAAISSPYQLRASPVYSESNDGHFNLFPFSNEAALVSSNISSLPVTPSSCSCEEENLSDIYTLQSLSRLTFQYQEIAEQYGICLTHLRETVREADALREENENLRSINLDLSKRLSLLSVSGKTNGSSFKTNSGVSSSNFNSMSMFNDFRRLCLGNGSGESGRVPVDMPENSPTSVLSFEENGGFDNHPNPGRATIPKSISIRSSGFLKVNQASGSARSPNRPNRLRVATAVAGSKAYIPSEKKDDEAVEVEVYNQGMFKTELCNKWQETGTCPYGDHCQFAHGVDELRPVLRHPRYKTELCRMVVAGETCPYGHRCHFRHALTEQERGSGHPF